MIHIVSDGTMGGTTIVDMDTGHHLENIVSKIDIEMNPGNNKVILTIPQVSIDMISDNMEVSNGK